MARVEKVVLDASIVIKWYVKESDSTLANIIKDDLERSMIDVLVPSLLFYEVLNVLRYKPDMGEADLEKVARSLDDLQFSVVHPNHEYGMEITWVALRSGITVYDAAYVALARRKSCLLFTADEKLRQRTEEERIIRSLQEYESVRRKNWKLPIL